MKQQGILYGLIGLVVGVLLTGIVMGKREDRFSPKSERMNDENAKMEGGKVMNNQEMMISLKGKTGDEFDKTFISEMIKHHQGAIEMAKAAQMNAKRPEIKKLADEIITAQEKEISQMKAWQMSWGFTK